MKNINSNLIATKVFFFCSKAFFKHSWKCLAILCSFFYEFFRTLLFDAQLNVEAAHSVFYINFLFSYKTKSEKHVFEKFLVCLQLVSFSPRNTVLPPHLTTFFRFSSNYITNENIFHDRIIQSDFAATHSRRQVNTVHFQSYHV